MRRTILIALCFVFLGLAPVFTAHAALSDTITSFWKLDETSGTRDDAVGSNDLADNNTVTSAVGKVGTAGQFTSANAEFLSLADNASLSTGDISFTVAGWVYLDSTTTTFKDIIGKWNTDTVNQREYILTYNFSTSRFNFNVSSTGSNSTTIAATTFGAASTGTWYFVVAWHDATANTINIQVNNGTVDSAAYTLGVFDSTAAFKVGSRTITSPTTTYMDGRIDALGFWKRTLTTGERSQLYNSGSGVEYPFVPNVPTSLSAISAGPTSVGLTWTAPTSTGYAVTDYVVEYKLTSEPVTWTTFADGTSTSTSATVTGLTQNLSYDFRVSATNTLGTGATSTTASATPTAVAPGAPTALASVAGDAQATLSWTAPASDGGSVITDYLVEYKLATELVTWTTFVDGTSTSTTATVTGLTNDSFYDFRISAINAIGTGSAGSSSTAIPSGVALKQNLFAFYDLDEASGSRDDSLGINTLSDSGSTGSTTGRVDTAASFTGTTHLTAADDEYLSTGDIDFTLAGWVYLTSKSVTQGLIGKWETGSTREYALTYSQTFDRFQFNVSSTGSDSNVVRADTFGSPSINTWYYIVAWHDAAGNTINITVNAGATDSAAFSSGVIDSSSIFSIGSLTLANFITGRVDAVGLWKRTLTSGERIELYNSAFGIEYPFVTADAINIESPAAYQVFQRDGSDLADITISGIYAGSPTAIEASWNGGPYTTIDASPSGNVFSGTLTNQSAGQGTLTARFTNNTSITDSIAYVGIGDIYVIAGQSNAVGQADNNQSFSHLTLKAGLFGNDDVWKELVDPTDDNTNQVDAVSSGVTFGGSAWPLLATHIMADQNIPVAFIPAAHNATYISDWQRNDSNHGDLSTLYGSMHRRITAVGGAKAVLFYLGESDSLNDTSQAAFKAGLDSLIADLVDDFGIKLVVGQIGHDTRVAQHDNNIRSAIIEVWDTNANAVAGPSTYDILTDDEGSDGIHFSSNTDMDIFAERWWASLLGEYYSGTDNGRGPIFSAPDIASTETQ